ncbi:hotdog domain-containing protein [Streptomyces sp. NPDC002055]|uniref:thioesterase family protein n=1 Tax=Streptomyces sp. NPDC002055 TaxID=3154534 RepID=UPI0033293C9E
MTLRTGARGSAERTVSEADTAAEFGSGDLPVLGTPGLLALLEAATVDALAGALEPGRTSVGTRVQVDHLKASPVGATVTATAEVTYLDGRLVRFTVAAQDGAGRLLATGEITRVIVDRDRFLARL